MTFIDVSTLLQPVHSTSPCGLDLEYSPAYLEAARALEGSPDVQYGNLHVAAIEPDWKRVKTATLALLVDTRDLRLAVWLTRALVALHGVIGIADGLALIEGLLARYWDELHPQLDADDDHDPTVRINTLLALNDKTAFVRELRAARLVGSERHGRICLADIERAAGEVNADESALEPAAIDAAFANAAIEDVIAVDDALASALSSLSRIDARFSEYLGHRRSVSLTDLEQVLIRASRAVHALRIRHPGLVASERDSAEPVASIILDGDRALDRITGRDDVLRLLDCLCRYYAAAEPSSPVPLLLQRARKLVGMGFADLVADLTPAGIEQVMYWVGRTPE